MKIRSFRKVDASGWPVQMHLVVASSGESIIYSPTWIDDRAIEEIANTSAPVQIVAPNHYHHLGLSRYGARFPTAQPLAARAAIARLRAKGHANVTVLEDVDAPKDVRWIVPEGLKNGEAWLSVQTEIGREWIVGDAFFNVLTSLRGIVGLFLRATSAAPGLSLGSTFRWLGVRDPVLFYQSVEKWLEEESPSRMHFCHGEPLDLNDTTRARMKELIRIRLALC